MQCGLLPDQVLNMDLVTLNACIEGYQDHMFDLKCIAVVQGFWAGYYSNTKKPKPVSKILDSMVEAHTKSKSARIASKHASDVDVEAFLRQEQLFKEMYNKAKEGR